MSSRIVMPITAAFFSFVTIARADVNVERKGPTTIKITLDRMITTQDAVIVSQLETELSRKMVEVLLNSDGGNLEAAIKIGRVLRAVDAATNIIGKCYGSCALIFIAGVHRFFDFYQAELGLYRPYNVSAPQSREALEQQVPAMLASLRKYVAEMGVGENFYQEMANTEPSRMKRYDAVGIGLLVPIVDPTYEELMTSIMASFRGLTTAEYRRRYTEGQRLCANRIELDCADAIMWGLSESIYRQRIQIADDSCKISDQDNRILESVSQKERPSHPALVAYHSCRRSIMLGR